MLDLEGGSDWAALDPSGLRFDDPILGKVAIPGLPVKFSDWPDRTELRSARLGEDNERILHDVLEMTDDQIAKLYADGVLVRDPLLVQS